MLHVCYHNKYSILCLESIEAGGGLATVSFVLDNSLGKDTNIFVNWPEDFDDPVVTLKLPTGDIAEPPDGWVSMDFSVQVTFTDQKFGGVTIKVKGKTLDNFRIMSQLRFSKKRPIGLGDVGHYDILIQNNGENPIPVSVTVNSFPRDDAFPVKMSTHAIDRETGEVTIFAELYQVRFLIKKHTCNLKIR